MDSVTLYIGLLGQFTIKVGDDDVVLPARKQRRLLAELALRRGQPVPREDLLLELWPDSDEQHARDSLRHALWRIRSQLGTAADLLHADGRSMLLDGRVRVDVIEFRCLANSDRPEDLRAALDLYHGDLCRELESEQAEVERERLRRLLVGVGRGVIERGREGGSPALVVDVARRILRHDPYQEDIHRQLLEALADAGDLSGVASHYRRLTQLLREDLGVEPSAETRDLYSRLIRGERPVTMLPSVREPSVEPPTSLVGRRDEYRQLIEIVTEAIDGRVRIGQIIGEAGAGKTRLLEEISWIAVDHGLRVLHGRAVGVEGQLGYQVWVDALRSAADDARALPSPWAGIVAALLPDVQPEVLRDSVGGVPQLERARLFEGVTRLLRRIALASPVLVVLDDLHWADTDALHLLHYLGRTLRDDRIAILTASRPIRRDGNATLDEVTSSLRSSGRLRVVELGPLSVSGVVQLIEQAGVREETAARLGPRVAEWTAGNPFFALETVRALEEQGVLRSGLDGRLDWIGSDHLGDATYLSQLPHGVRQTIVARVDILPEETRPVLNIAAAAGRVFSPELLSAVSGRDEIAIIDTLVPAMTAGLLREAIVDDQPALAFNHDLVREAIYQQQPPILRAAIHRRIADALSTLDGPSGVIAYHLTAAGDSHRALEHWIAAGEAAEATYAHEEALRAYEQASAMVPENDNLRRLAISERLAAVHQRRGAIQDAIIWYDRALSLVGADDAGTAARLKTRIAFACGRQYGRHPLAREYAGQAVSFYERHGRSQDLCEALLALAFMQYQQLDTEPAQATARRALALSRELDQPRFEAAAIHALAWSQWLNDAPIVFPELHSAEALAERLGVIEDTGYLYEIIATAASHRGEFCRASEHAGHALRIARQLGSLRLELMALEMLATMHCYLGRTEEAIRFAQEALDITDRIAPGGRIVSLPALHALAGAHALAGDRSQSLDMADRLLSMHAEEDPTTRPVHHYRIGAYRIYLLLGCPERVPDLDILLRYRPLCRTCDLHWLTVAGQRAAWSDNPVRALTLAGELDERVSATGAGLHRGWGSYISSISLQHLDRLDDACTALDRASSEFQAIGNAWGLFMVNRMREMTRESA